MAPPIPSNKGETMIRVVEFSTEYRVGKDPIDWVMLAPQGPAFEKVRTWHRVNSLRPPENIDQRQADSERYQDIIAKWSVIGPAYEAWKGGQEAPENGTPLAAWPGVTADQAKFLRAMAIRTVEDVRDMGDAAISALRWPNARQLPKTAKAYLEGTDAASKDAELASMREQMAAMQELLEEQMPAAPKRGRPRKDAEAA